MSTPNRDIPYVPENTLDPAAGLNEALDIIDAIIVPKVIRMDLTAPPVGPADGDLYIPAPGATGDWADLDNYLVRYRQEGDFYQAWPPEQVNLLLNGDDGGLYSWDLGLSPAQWVPAIPQQAYAPVVTEATDTRVASPSDAGTYTRFTEADPKTWEFDGGESWVLGTEFHGRNAGAGNLTVFGSGGFTINPPTDGTNVIPEGGTFTLKIVAADEADLFGVTVPQS